MSAWIVSQTHIDLLVSALVKMDILDTTPNESGRRLWRENIASVRYRYKDSNLDELPGPIPTPDPETYVFQAITLHCADTHRIRILKAINCYEYQSCEYPEWRDSWAWERLEELKALVILSLHPAFQHLEPSPYGDQYEARPAVYSSPLYDAAPWGED